MLQIRKERELSIIETGKLFKISPTSIVKWSKNILAKVGRKKGATRIDMQALANDIKEHPDSYHYERAIRFGVSIRTIGYALKRLRVTYKKTLNHPKARPEERTIFQEKIKTYQEANRTIIYIDESGFGHDMPRTHGYALKGQRCYGTHDWGARGRTNAVGALIGKELLTVSLFDETINTEVFNSWVEQDLIPKLPRGSVIVMDNAAFHKDSVMQEQIKEAGHILEYLPPYSPDLNPIEHKWAQAKALRRKHSCDIDSLFRDFCL